IPIVVGVSMISLQRNLRRIAILAVALTGFLAFGQFETATLTGVVTDSAGAVVPNATVKAINEATNIEATVTSNNEGRYLFPNLRPGSYKVTASVQGFKQFVSSGLIL